MDRLTGLKFNYLMFMVFLMLDIVVFTMQAACMPLRKTGNTIS